MTKSSNFKTDQELFWAGDFGSDYTDRNQGGDLERSNLMFWGSIIKRTGVLDNCFELGCNRGLNLNAIKALLPDCKTSGLEINSYAAEECKSKGHNVFEGSILSPPTSVEQCVDSYELSLIAGVLIHINPDSLGIAYDTLYKLSSKYVLISEYFNPVPVEVSYRGHSGRLFKRDFAREFWSRYPSLSLVDYGFIWSEDPVAPKDNLTWFLFRK